MRALGEVTARVATWNPSRSDEPTEFNYIDLSAVDNGFKEITAPTRMSSVESPSRARQIVATGDVLVSTVRPNLNAVAMVPPSLDGATASTGFTVLRPTDEVDGRYLFHWVRSDKFIGEMVRRATGASYPAVSDRLVKESTLPLPSVGEQRRIAAILDQADALRAKRRQALAQLDDFNQAILYDQFGDPWDTGNKYPRGVLGDLIHAALDGPHVSPTYAEEGVPFLSTRHVRPGHIEWTDLKFLSPQDAETQWRKCRPELGDVLYTKGGTTGMAAAVRTSRDFAVWVHVAVLKTRRDVVDPIWLEAMLNSPYCYAQSQRLTRGIANRDLGLKRMVGIELLVPPLLEQKQFAVLAGQVAMQRDEATRAAERDDELFASLRFRAFRGEL